MVPDSKSSLGKFASLRKGGKSLSKNVRDRFSRSFIYSRSNSEPDNSFVGKTPIGANSASSQTSTTTAEESGKSTESTETEAVVSEQKNKNKFCLFI